MINAQNKHLIHHFRGMLAKKVASFLLLFVAKVPAFKCQQMGLGTLITDVNHINPALRFRFIPAHHCPDFQTCFSTVCHWLLRDLILYELISFHRYQPPHNPPQSKQGGWVWRFDLPLPPSPLTPPASPLATPSPCTPPSPATPSLPLWPLILISPPVLGELKKVEANIILG